MYRTMLRDQIQIGCMHTLCGNIAFIRIHIDVIAMHVVDVYITLAQHFQIGSYRHLDQAINMRAQLVHIQLMIEWIQRIDRDILIVHFNYRLEIGDCIGDFGRWWCCDAARL